MKLLILLLVNILNVFGQENKSEETEKHKIFSVCKYYTYIGNDATEKECITCLNEAYGSVESQTPSDENLKECMATLPERFKSCAEKENPTASFIQEILKWREEQRVLFATRFKDMLSFKEIDIVFEICAGFFMAYQMGQDLPKNQLELALKPVFKCLEPGVDMKRFDNEVMSEQDVENEISKDESAMANKAGSKVMKRQATEDDVSIRVRVKNIYKSIYSYYICSINRIGEDKEASSIVKDYLLDDYEGIVPAKVARDACKW